MTANQIVKRMLLLRGNETSMLDINTQMMFDEILIELVEIENNIRWCSNKNCKCHPESKIKSLIQNEEIYRFLNAEKLWDDIYNLVNAEYKPITVFDLGLVQ